MRPSRGRLSCFRRSSACTLRTCTGPSGRAWPPSGRRGRRRSIARYTSGSSPRARPPATPPQPWRVPTVPAELRKPGIEITGPASITPMFINALNPGVDGVRAEGDLDDDEDSAGHRLVDTVRAAQNRMQAVGGGPDVPRRGSRARLRRAGGVAALLHAPGAGAAPRRAGGHDRGEAGVGGHPRRVPHALPRGARAGGARARHLLLPAQD